MTSQEALAHRAFDDLSCIYDEPTCHQAFYIEDELESPQPITVRLRARALRINIDVIILRNS